MVEVPNKTNQLKAKRNDCLNKLVCVYTRVFKIVLITTNH